MSDSLYRIRSVLRLWLTSYVKYRPFFLQKLTLEKQVGRRIQNPKIGWDITCSFNGSILGPLFQPVQNFAVASRHLKVKESWRLVS